MKNLIFILKLLLFTSLFGEAYSVSTISMFNFNNSSFDKNDTEDVNEVSKNDNFNEDLTLF